MRLSNFVKLFTAYLIQRYCPLAERDVELTKEAHRQEENDKLRKEFAKHANAFHQWLTETRYVK